MAFSISGTSVAALAAEAGLLVLATIVVYYTLLSRRPKNFPPGPPTLPLLGNLHQFPKTKAFLKFHEWGQHYGSIIGLKIGPQNVVILNDYKHVQELFDARGGKYSSRPPSHITNDLICQNQTSVLNLPYGNDWKVLRKAFQTLLGSHAADSFVPIQTAEAVQTMHQLLHDPQNWYDHIRRYPTAVILASVYGLRGTNFDSPRVKSLYSIVNQFTEISEFGATPPVDVFPFLKYLPDFLAAWRVWAMKIRTEAHAFWFEMMEETKSHMQQENISECFMARMIKEQEKNGLDDEHIAYVGGFSLMGGSDTTASTLLSFILAMVKHPEALKRCREEVDAVCGTLRSPVLDDMASLPYIRATMNETLRWRPIVASGLPHALTEDDTYEGYFLPKGTILFANTWSIHRTSEFVRPDQFIPERYLGNKFGTISNDDSDDKRRIQYGFGAGRRVCAGQRLAETSLLINMAKLVWGFNISAGADHVDDSVVTGYTDGFLIAPHKFPVHIEPRSPEHIQTLEREYVESEQYLSRFKD